MSSTYLWYLTRASGLVTLVLLTGAVVLGMLTSSRTTTRNWPGFALAEIHKRVALICTGFLGLHIVTTVLDSYVPIGWYASVLPFSAAYKRPWLGLGTVAVDLMLIVIVSSLLRHRIPARLWRSLHWLTYLSFPVAVLHSIETGTDAHLRWVQALVALCVAAVAAAGGLRLTKAVQWRALAR